MRIKRKKDLASCTAFVGLSLRGDGARIEFVHFSDYSYRKWLMDWIINILRKTLCNRYPPRYSAFVVCIQGHSGIVIRRLLEASL